MKFFCRQLLSEAQLDRIDKVILSNDASWTASQPNYYNGFQTNLELDDRDARELVKREVMAALDADLDFAGFTLPSRSGYFLVSRTEPGQEFFVHHDNPLMGHYSTTVFLSDPSDYKGGALCLSLDRDEEFRLPKGWAITYETGVPHKVTQVQEGVRHVAVTWTTSMVKDSFDRHAIRTLRKAASLMDAYQPTASFAHAAENPYFLLRGLENELLRKHLK